MHMERLIDQQKGFDKDFVDRHREDLGLLFIDEEYYEEEDEVYEQEREHAQYRTREIHGQAIRALRTRGRGE